MFDFDSKSWRFHGAPQEYFTQQSEINVPSRYVNIIKRTVKLLERSGKPPITNHDNYHYRRLKYFLNKSEDIENEYPFLEPLAVYRNRRDGKYFEFYLTKEDFMVILKCSFVIDRETLRLTLNQLNIKTKNNNEIYESCSYKWKILSRQQWRLRYQRLLKDKWGWNGSTWQSKEIKDKIINNIESGKYYKILEKIREEIENNHLIETGDYVLMPKELIKKLDYCLTNDQL